MSEELKLKPCPRCRKDVSVIHAHGCKFIHCDCGIQSSRYGEHIADWRMAAAWNYRAVEDSHAVRIAELEADVNRVKAESDIAWRSESKMTGECVRLRKALKEIAKLADSEYGKRIPAPSCVEFLTIKQYAEKALEGVENVEKDS